MKKQVVVLEEEELKAGDLLGEAMHDNCAKLTRSTSSRKPWTATKDASDRRRGGDYSSARPFATG